MDLKITVRNKKTYKGKGEYVGRSSVLGNRFKMKSEDDRKEVVTRFKVWLWQQMQADNREVLNELYRLLLIAREEEELNLICWCAPEACHADVIAAAIRYLHKKKEDEFQQAIANRLRNRDV
jgi:hypothetical protein